MGAFVSYLLPKPPSKEHFKTETFTFVQTVLSEKMFVLSTFTAGSASACF